MWALPSDVLPNTATSARLSHTRDEALGHVHVVVTNARETRTKQSPRLPTIHDCRGPTLRDPLLFHVHGDSLKKLIWLMQ